MVTARPFLLTITVLCSACTALAEGPLKPGAQAPDFTLSNQDGDEVALGELLKKQQVALVFYRSADW